MTRVLLNANLPLDMRDSREDQNAMQFIHYAIMIFNNISIHNFEY